MQPKKIKYNSSLTENCSSCFLIVGVTNKLKFEERESKFISEYNIMVKDYKNKGNFNDNAINIPINEFIVGSIEWKKEYNDSYTLDILDNYNRKCLFIRFGDFEMTSILPPRQDLKKNYELIQDRAELFDIYSMKIENFCCNTR